MGESHAITEGVYVRVESFFIPERSRQDDAHFFFAYRVTIENQGSMPVKLLARHWTVLDQNDHREDVRGPGVVGEQPLLKPGESFNYTSACVLKTPRGQMFGTYRMLQAGGYSFDAVVAPFDLTPQQTVH